MKYEEAKMIKERLECECNEMDKDLRKFPRLPNGLTPDNVKQTLEWQNAKFKFNHSMEKVRAFNQLFLKTFKKEYKLDRESMRLTK